MKWYINDGELRRWGSGTVFEVPDDATEVIVPEGVTRIGFNAFQECTNLTSITLPASMTDVTPSEFSDCFGLIDIHVHPDNPEYADVDGVLYDKMLTDMLWCPQAKRAISVPESVTRIISDTFDDCSGLSDIHVHPENPNFADVDGVLYDKALTSLIRCPQTKRAISLPASVTWIGSGALNDCSGLSDIHVHPENPAYADVDGVLYNKALTQLIRFPQRKEATEIPEGVTHIGNWAFKDCKNLQSIALPEGVTRIGNCAFEGCASLTSITIPEGVTSIGSSAFEGCGELTSITLPASVTSLSSGWGDFSCAGCGCLKDIHVHPDNPEYADVDGVLYDKKLMKMMWCPQQKEEIAVPESVDRIPVEVISHCKNLRSVDFRSCEKRDTDWVAGLANRILAPGSLANLMLYQSGKKWQALLEESEKTHSEHPDAVIDALVRELEPMQKLSKAQTVLFMDFVLTYGKNAGQACLAALYQSLLKRNKGAAAQMAELGLASGGGAKKAEGPFELRDDCVARVNDSKKAVALPDAMPLATDALKETRAPLIKVSDKNTGITLAWLERAAISRNVGALEIPVKVLKRLHIHEEKPYTWSSEIVSVWNAEISAYSPDVRRALKPTGKVGKGDALDFGRLLRDALDWSAKEIVDFLLAVLDGEKLFQMLRPDIEAVLPALPDATAIDEAALDGLTVSDAAKQVMDLLAKLNPFLGKDPKLTYAESGRPAPWDPVRALLTRVAAGLAGIDGPEVKLLGLLNREQLGEHLRQGYRVNVADANTADISPLIRALGQLGSLKQITGLISDYKNLERRMPAGNTSRWNVYQAIYASLGKNADREVLLQLDKRGLLSAAAKARGVDEEALRDALVNNVDDQFDAQGRVFVDYGPRQFTLTLLPNMSFEVLDNVKGKVVKTLPKPGAKDEAEKAKPAYDSIKKLQTSVKNIAAKATEQVKGLLYAGNTLGLADWQSRFSGSTVTRVLARGILWGVYQADGTLVQPFRMNAENQPEDVSGGAVALEDGARIGVVDAAELGLAGLEAWRKVFWGEGIKQVVRQFEAPAIYTPVEYLKERYKGCTVSVGYARHALGYDPYDDFVEVWVEGSFVRVSALQPYRHATEGDMTVDEVTADTKGRTFDQMTDREKRLLNRDIIRMDSIFHPETQTGAIVAGGEASAVQKLIDAHMITPDNVLEMLDVSIKNGNTEVTALLLAQKQAWLGDLMDPDLELSL